MLFDVLFGHGKDERDHRERGTTIRFRGKLKEKRKENPAKRPAPHLLLMMSRCHHHPLIRRRPSREIRLHASMSVSLSRAHLGTDAVS
jgi:hypothetical protein